MLMPSIFGEDMFDEFMRDFPFFDERDERRARSQITDPKRFHEKER